MLSSPAQWDLWGALSRDKASSVVFDYSKWKRLVPDYTVAVRLDQGVSMAADYVFAHPECQKQDSEFADGATVLSERRKRRLTR